ncbi:acyl-coenzyme A diphosphatase NUDT19 [Patella vulgata]|uniref:acyl-coenzyme A diphosphatase NUDT19 n=1 Tax=Patella vulgata TaxID=6465 RepID=UPI0024A92C5C|nr:acyl-coenzyme A diphosphatase NUDT19 [Patella vulgata]
MATVLKHWREAATLVLVTGRNTSLREGIRFKPVNASVINNNNVNGNNADENALKGVNFEVMLLKRSSKSKFMPSLYVFPGGVASDADFSEKWKAIFHDSNNELVEKTFEYAKRGGIGPPMFSRVRDAQFSQIPSEIAFRICAIRETFEESGVLLARNAADMKTIDTDFMKHGPVKATAFQMSEIHESWRKKVYADASEFVTMCQELNIIPDVWSLYEWSNWLTPTGQDKFAKYGRRYDTAFYVACVPDKPDAMEDQGETVHLQWGSPADILTEYMNGNAKIAPPQLYELSRFLNFENIEDLHRFIWQREEHRVKQYLPVRVRCQDAYLFLLPGDDLYPKEPDFEGKQEQPELSETLEELNCKFPNQHRTFLSGESDHVIVGCNIPLPGGHVPPVSEPPISQISKL